MEAQVNTNSYDIVSDLSNDLDKFYLLNIMGEEWTIKVIKRGEKEQLDNSELLGWADYSNREVTVLDYRDYYKNGYDCPEVIFKKTLRHELIHAFIYESGIGVAYFPEEAEVMIDWWANNYGKINKVFKQLHIEDLR